MKTYLFILLTFMLGSDAFAALNTEISCEMKRAEWDRMTFEFRFLTPKRGVTAFRFQKGELSGAQSIPVSAIHQSTEARYVGLNFLSEEKLVFIFVTPILDPQSLGIPMEIEVVSSIYGPSMIKCRATR